MPQCHRPYSDAERQLYLSGSTRQFVRSLVVSVLPQAALLWRKQRLAMQGDTGAEACLMGSLSLLACKQSRAKQSTVGSENLCAPFAACLVSHAEFFADCRWPRLAGAARYPGLQPWSSGHLHAPYAQRNRAARVCVTTSCIEHRRVCKISDEHMEAVRFHLRFLLPVSA